MNISKEELDKLAIEHFECNKYEGEEKWECDAIDAYKAGFHKALEYLNWEEPIICKCQWEDYYEFHIMFQDGKGHVRLSFFNDGAYISDLYVAEDYRCKGYGTILLNKVDELLNGNKAIIYPILDWHKTWYEKRGYIIGKDAPLNEATLN